MGRGSCKGPWCHEVWCFTFGKPRLFMKTHSSIVESLCRRSLRPRASTQRRTLFLATKSSGPEWPCSLLHVFPYRWTQQDQICQFRCGITLESCRCHIVTWKKLVSGLHCPCGVDFNLWCSRTPGGGRGKRISAITLKDYYIAIHFHALSW